LKGKKQGGESLEDGQIHVYHTRDHQSRAAWEGSLKVVGFDQRPNNCGEASEGRGHAREIHKTLKGIAGRKGVSMNLIAIIVFLTRRKEERRAAMECT